MSKLSFLLMSFTFTIFTTLVVDSLDEYNTTTDVTENMPSGVDRSATSIFSAFRTYFELLTFQIEDIPFMFNLVFTIISVGILYIIIDKAVHLVPFT